MSQFRGDCEALIAGQYDAWQHVPLEALAGVILGDQLMRNAFRGTPKMYAADPKVLAWSKALLVSRGRGQVWAGGGCGAVEGMAHVWMGGDGSVYGGGAAEGRSSQATGHGLERILRAGLERPCACSRVQASGAEQLTPIQQVWLAMTLMHSEELADQEVSGVAGGGPWCGAGGSGQRSVDSLVPPPG